jgi:pimeloyl-ACP methyl ester carboxylesterase
LKIIKKIIIGFVVLFNVMMVAFARVDVPFDVIIDTYATDYSTFVDINIKNLDEQDVPLRIHVQHLNKDKEDVLVLTHGVFSSSHTFLEAAPYFDAYQLVLIDLPGHGLSSLFPDDVTGLRRHTEVVYETLKMLSIDTFFIGGNSLGGGVAWYFLYLHQNHMNIKGLILIDALSPDLMNIMMTPSLDFMPSFMTRLLSSFTPRGLFQSTLNDVYGASVPSDNMVQRHYDLVRREGVRRQVPIMQWEPLETVDFYQIIDDSQIPVLILWGDVDQIIPVDVASTFAERIRNHTLIVYEDVGHEPHGENTEQFSRDVIEFLNIHE